MDEQEERDVADRLFTAWYFAQPPESQIVGHIEHMMCSLRDLPEFACTESPLVADAHSFPAVFACREAFYVHVRAAAEFFWKLPSKDFTAKTFLPAWSLDGPPAAELERLWELTSKHIVHMSRARAPSDSQPSEDTSFRGLCAVAMSCWNALDQFTDAYAATGAEYAAQFQRVRDTTRPSTAESLANPTESVVQSERWAGLLARLTAAQ
jgi:hypothetical protein